ncbi:MAG: hypothetical protein R3F30_00435 [Planctomycetota bacterium]
MAERIDRTVPWSFAPPRAEALLARRKELRRWGLPFEAVLIPRRAARAHVPGTGRPAFLPDHGSRIRRDEALHDDDLVAATPNRFPFFARQVLLWPSTGFAREPDPAWLARCLDLCAAWGGSLLMNSIGASASIPLAHAHLADERSAVLDAWPLVDVPGADGGPARVGGDDGPVLRAGDPDAGPPVLLVVLDGGATEARARVACRLLQLRSFPSHHLLAQGDRLWLVPRSREIVAEAAPWAIGGAELWGRFVFPDEESYDAFDERRLGLALAGACRPASVAELAALEALAADPRQLSGG